MNRLRTENVIILYQTKNTMEEKKQEVKKTPEQQLEEIATAAGVTKDVVWGVVLSVYQKNNSIAMQRNAEQKELNKMREIQLTALKHKNEYLKLTLENYDLDQKIDVMRAEMARTQDK